MKSSEIPFNKPLLLGNEIDYVKDAISRGHFCGDGYYTKKCEEELLALTDSNEVLLTSSCTHALEMAAMLLDIKAGDEVIMASFNFVSAANAFVLRGAKIIFIDIREDTLNINEQLIESAITEKTKAILVMHYAGVACEMDTIMDIAHKYDIKVVEDAAHCIDSYHKGRHLGSIGDIGALSFHSTKNIHCGEGGALLINNKKYIERAFVLREKGTNRRQFVNGLVEKYSWVDIGSSYLMNEMSAAFLYPQLLAVKSITEKRKEIVSHYANKLLSTNDSAKIIEGNGHIFYLLLESNRERQRVIANLKSQGISAYFHYVPLHSSQYSKHATYDSIKLPITQKMSDRILRLPLSFDQKKEQLDFIIEKVLSILNENPKRNKRRMA